MRLNRKLGEAGLVFVPILIILAICVLAAVIYASKNSEPEKMPLPLGLLETAMVVPDDNRITKPKAELGYLLFFDKRLSPNGKIACANCHKPELAFTDGLPVSVGIDGKKGDRNAPSIINRLFSHVQFWDSRAKSLEEQVSGPLLNRVEHGFKTEEEIIAAVKGIPEYKKRFESVFHRPVNIEDIERAIATFERTVLSGNSRFDKHIAARERGETSDFTEQELRGERSFRAAGRCGLCHGGFNFTDEERHDIGVDAEGTPFKTPSLREVSKTAPYMHNGSIATLEEAVHFCAKHTEELFGEVNRKLEATGQDMTLTPEDELDIVSFLKTLEGEGYQHIKAP